jgi:hypothetical protein
MLLSFRYGMIMMIFRLHKSIKKHTHPIIFGEHIKMRTKSIMPIILAVAIATLLVTPAFAARPETLGKGPKYDKYVAPLQAEDGTRYGQVIFNTNPEDNGTYELEVEIEECTYLANSNVTVFLNETEIGTIEVDEYGNGKATFYVGSISTGSTVTVVGDEITLTSGEWRLWVKVPGPK